MDSFHRRLPPLTIHQNIFSIIYGFPYREDRHQPGEVGGVLEQSGREGRPVDTVVAPDLTGLLVHLQAGAGGQEDGAGLLLHPPDLLPGPGVDGPQAGGRDDVVARHGDDTLLHGGDIVTVSLTPPVLQSEHRNISRPRKDILEDCKLFLYFDQKAQIADDQRPDHHD